MSTTPTSLRFLSSGREVFSHERLLQVCYYYRNLLTALRATQGEINEALEEFQHSQYGRPSEPLTRLITALANIDAGVRGPLLDEIMQVELTIVKWEGKTSKLKSEAKRQARIRAERRGPQQSYAPDDSTFTYPEPGEPCDPFGDEAGRVAPAAPPQLSPTFARALRGMKELPQTTPTNDAPDTSTYKKSGLV